MEFGPYLFSDAMLEKIQQSQIRYGQQMLMQAVDRYGDQNNAIKVQHEQVCT
jgi:hypothetical protein